MRSTEFNRSPVESTSYLEKYPFESKLTHSQLSSYNPSSIGPVSKMSETTPESLQRSSIGSTRNSFANSFDEQLVVWDIAQHSESISSYKAWSAIPSSFCNSKNKASLFIRTVREFDSVKAVKALPLKSFTKPNGLPRSDNNCNRSYNLNKSREEINKIYKLNKFKKKIRLNLFLDNLVLGTANKKDQKKFPRSSKVEDKRSILTIHSRKKLRGIILKHSLGRLPRTLLSRIEPKASEQSVTLNKAKSALD